MSMTISDEKTGFSSGSTSQAVSLPATINVGDLLILLFCKSYSASTITSVIDSTSDAWTNLSPWTSDGSDLLSGIWYKFADGDEDGGTVTVVSSVAGNAAVGIVIRVENADNGQAPEDATAWFTSLSASPRIDPPSVTASWGAEATNLFIECGFGEDDDATFIAASTNYGGLQFQVGGAGDDASCEAGYATRVLNSATDDPDNSFELSENESRMGMTIVIRELVAAGIVGRRRIEGY